VNNKTGRKIAGGCDDGFTCWQTVGVSRLPDAPALFDNSGTTAPVDGTINATTSKERRICGINDRVTRLDRDVTGFYRKPTAQEFFFHRDQPRFCGQAAYSVRFLFRFRVQSAGFSPQGAGEERDKQHIPNSDN
jgi:hypothetical protein